jgi:SLBB domain-containing protein
MRPPVVFIRSANQSPFLTSRRLHPRLGLHFGALVLAACLCPVAARAQERSGYLPGVNQGLEMMVHVIGEVQKPGEYRVPDQTDLLQLLSKAGGPTQFSRLSSVSVRRVVLGRPLAGQSDSTAPRVQILHVNIEDVLRRQDAAPPLLQPGDVVFVPKNGWHKWKDVSGVIRDLSVVASAYFLYVRAYRN